MPDGVWPVEKKTAKCLDDREVRKRTEKALLPIAAAAERALCAMSGAKYPVRSIRCEVCGMLTRTRSAGTDYRYQWQQCLDPQCGHNNGQAGPTNANRAGWYVHPDIRGQQRRMM